MRGLVDVLEGASWGESRVRRSKEWVLIWRLVIKRLLGIILGF